MCTRNKVYNKLLLIIFTAGIMMWPGMLFAQDESCQGGDPTGSSTTCPLDTWVWVLVATAAILGAVILSKKQKLQERS
jgi:hypothetical protein